MGQFADDLNQVTTAHALAEIGANGIEAIHRIYNHIAVFMSSAAAVALDASVPASPTLAFRYAPSVVTRSEAELFGVSLPRFALRTHLHVFGFANIRRLVRLRSAVGDGWGTRPAMSYDDFAGNPPSGSISTERLQRYEGIYQPSDTVAPSNLFDASRCVADSLLTLPRQVIDALDLTLLSASLGVAYGEPSFLSGTPFVQHIRIGGGMCAQAACLMTAMLLHQHCAGIHGFAEMSALAYPPDLADIPLAGLTAERVVEYFRNIGLSAMFQSMYWREGFYQYDAADISEDVSIRVMIDALYAYVRSGLPVILPVNQDRMTGPPPDEDWPLPSILARNKAKRRSTTRVHSSTLHDMSANHAVVLVGCAPTGRSSLWSDDREFVVNDPATVPFLLASGCQLAMARPYAPPRQERKAGEPRTNLLPFTYIAVSPREVELPLLTLHLHKLCSVELLASYFLSNSSLHRTCPDLDRPSGTAFRSYFLRQTRLIETSRLRSESGAVLDFDSGTSTFLRELAAASTHWPKWIWIQQFDYLGEKTGANRNTLWIWDATEKPVTQNEFLALTPNQQLKKYILAVGVRKYTLAVGGRYGKESHWTLPWDRESASGSSAEKVSAGQSPATAEFNAPREISNGNPNGKPLEISLLSSFTARETNRAAKQWPTDQTTGKPYGVELYCYMLDDLAAKGGLLSSVRLAPQSALNFMAAHCNDLQAITDHAAQLVKAFKSAGPIRGLASFIPEVTALPYGDARIGQAQNSNGAWRDARDAIKYLLRLASAINSSSKKDSVGHVEMVCGSRVDGVWPGLGSDPKHDRIPCYEWRCFATRMSCQFALRRMLDCVASAMRGVPVPKTGQRIVVALELEPGPLYALSGMDALRTLISLLSHARYSDVRDLVRLNLDVPHWIMAGIPASDFKNESAAFRTDPVLQQIRRLIVNAHIGGHHLKAHLGDSVFGEPLGLPIGQETKEWLEVIREINAERQGMLMPPIGLSLEYEAAAGRRLVQQSLRNLSATIQ